MSISACEEKKLCPTSDARRRCRVPREVESYSNTMEYRERAP